MASGDPVEEHVAAPVVRPSAPWHHGELRDPRLVGVYDAECRRSLDDDTARLLFSETATLAIVRNEQT